MSHFHNAKIIATMGPAIDKETVLSKVVNDIDVFRINLSHGDEETKRKYIDIILKLDSSKTIMLDLKGPEIRTKNKQELLLKKGEKIHIAYAELFQQEEHKLLIDYPNPQRVPTETIMSIDNDQVKLKIIGSEGNELIGEVIVGGTIRINKVVDFDNYIPKLPFLTEKDKQQIIRGVDNKINLIAVGSIREADNLLHIKQFLADHGGERVKIIAKLETSESIEFYDHILEQSNGIMLNREKLHLICHEDNIENKKAELIRKANLSGKPIMMSAGLSITGDDNKKILKKITEEIQLGVDALLLTKETAVGPEPLDTITMCYELINDQIHQPKTTFTLDDINSSPEMMVTDYIINTAYEAMKKLDIKAVICPTENGYTPARLSALKTPVPIISFTKNDAAYRYMNLLRGVKGYKIASSFDYAKIKQIGKEMIRILFKGNISLDDKILIVHSQGTGGDSSTLNSVELYKFKDI